MSFVDAVRLRFFNSAPHDLCRAIEALNLQPERAAVNREFNKAFYPTSQTRFRLNQPDPARMIFDVAFKNSPREIINAAGVRYPLWKRVALIEAPRKVAKVIGQPAFAYPAGVVLGCFGMFRFYTVASSFITGSVVPFFAKNTPLAITELFHRTVQLFNTLYDNGFKVLAAIWITKNAILHFCPEIPYASPALRTLDLSSAFWAFVRGPESVFHFLASPLIDVTRFLISGFENAEKFLQDTADLAERESFAACKEVAYERFRREWRESGRN